MGNFQIPTLDVEQFRAELRRNGTELVQTQRPARPESTGVASALAAMEAPLNFTQTGDYRQLPLALGRALSDLEVPRAQALKEEILHLVRFFIGLTEAPEVRVSLAFSNALPDSNGSQLTLLSPLLNSPSGRWFGLPPRSVSIMSGDQKGSSEAPTPIEGANQLILSVSTDQRPFFLENGSGSGESPALASAEARDVVLISMPFGPLYTPSLGLSLLKAALDDGVCEILYFTLPFAERMGAAFYNWICDSNPTEESLAGEWIFSSEEDLSRPESYFRQILPDLPDFLAEDLLLARGKADPFLKDCVDQVVARRPKIVGFTSTFQQHRASLALAKRLKSADPDIAILFGGANCEGVMGLETLRSFDFVDAVVCGEADRVFPKLVERLLHARPLSDLPGVLTRANLREAGEDPPNTPLVVTMDDLPRPDFSDFFRQWNATPALGAHRPKLPLETSRGCWWGAKQHCTFCGLNGKSMSFRSKSAERAFAELAELTERYPGLPVSVVDNILDLKYFKSLLPELAEKKLGIELFFEVKANLRKEQIRLLREAGVTSVQPGIESLSDRVLRIMRKGVTGLQNIQLLKWCLELGVSPFWNMIWGFPGEPPEAYERMAELMPLLHHLPPPDWCGPLRLDRFSPNFDQAEELGFSSVAAWPAYRHVYPVSDEAIGNLAYYFRFRYRDGRDPATYATPVTERAEEWQEAFDSSRLTYTDNGRELRIRDGRRVAARELTELAGVERQLFLECDGIRSLASLRGVASRFTGRPWSDGGIEEVVAPWIRDGLMIQNGHRILALAVSETTP